MSQASSRRSHAYGSVAGSAINQKAALASAYQELGKELSSTKLKMVGNYTLQRPIGEGTYGKVRLGLHRLTNTRVAMKQIPKAHSASLTREIHHHRRLHHPNVMQLYEVIATEQYIWMVSELCAGGELYDYLVENEVLAEPEARRIFGQLCLAVAYIHSKGIVHRDLKLENILLDEQCNIKLGDFGFTREFDGKRLMETFCGTTGYASPEMLACKKYTGEEVDIWSLGIILYALLCGALPFDDDDEDVMKQKIVLGDYEVPDCLSEEAQDLVRSILQQDPTKRPSIRSILAHPWFSKTMQPNPMSTVEENDLSSEHAHNNAAASVPLQATGSKGSQNDTGSRQTAQGASDSVHSSRSDGGSSDHRSSGTDLTDPTTADSLSRSDTDNAFATSDKSPAEGQAITPKDGMGLHRNESQTTIRRTGSDTSDASHGTTSRAPTRSASTFLPTHHELPGHHESSSDDGLTPLYQSVPLSKRGSQSSSRGHHRTPSRTKRRSASSSGLSDHHPPHLGRKPVDYLSQIKTLQPATFSTAVEQSLLHQLSSLGFDVGQMVHSVVNDACDTSGAMWWMLLRKAKDKPAQQLSENEPIGPTDQTEASTFPLPPPPLPEKAASRRLDDLSKSRLSSSRSENSGLSDIGSRPPDGMPTSVSLADLRSTAFSDDASSAVVSSTSSDSPLRERSASDVSDASSFRPTAQHRHTTATTTPSKLRQVSDADSGTSTPDSGKAPRKNSRAERPRSNSLSVKQFAQSMLGSKDKGPAAPDQVIVAGESLLVERAKSPTIFGRRNTVGNAKDSLVGRLSSPSTPKKTSTESPSQEGRRPSLGKISLESQGDRSSGRDDTPSRELPAEGSSTPAGEPSKNAMAGSSSISQESFSTTSMTPQGSEKSNSKSKPGSSFISTVRTWLGANEKPGKKGKGVKKAPLNQAIGPNDAARKSTAASPALNTASRTSSVRRRSSHYHQGSVGRRGPRSPHMTPSSRRSSADRLHQSELAVPSHAQGRPANLRRTSAGSITPTASYYGDYWQDHPNALRHSRPSSSHSHAITPLHSGLRGKTGSTGSTSSAIRGGATGSTYSSGSQRRHARRMSHETGTTTVRRHRTYASSTGSPSRTSSIHHHSRPSSIRSRTSSPGPGTDGPIDEADAGGKTTRSARSTPRHSLDIRGPLDSTRKADSSGRASPTHSYRQSHQPHSVFVAHKTRTPYKPPSANPSLHTSGSRSTGLPQVGTGPWRHSWGRPPPCWAGPVDPPPQNSAVPAASTDMPRLRNVFARRDDDDWTDEDEEPSYAGGLGQLSSLHSTASSQTSSSPFATRNFAALSDSAGPGAQQFSSRYAGVRGIFPQPSAATLPSGHRPHASLSLGNEFAPKVLSSTLHAPSQAPRMGVSTSLAALDQAFATANHPPSSPLASPSPQTTAAQQQNAGSRIMPSFNKPTQIIEEDEEDE